MDEKESREDELVFRYSREKRLRHASESVRRLNDPDYRKRPSLFQTLVPNRASAFLLLTIFMLSATVVVTRLLVPPPDTAALAGNRLVLSAFRYQGGTYLAIKKNRLKPDAYQGPVDLTIAGSDAEAPTTRKIALGAQDAEEIRFSIDGEHERVEVTVAGGGGAVTLKTAAE